MKKYFFVFNLFFLLIALYSCNEQLEISNQESLNFKQATVKPFESLPNSSDMDYCGEPISCKLIAGQNIDAGTVAVSNDLDYLYVEVYSTDGFQDVDENIKIWIGLNEDLPTKRPPAGLFSYKVKESGDTHIFKILLSSLDGWDVAGSCEQNFNLIVHADVLTEAGNSESGETAFGGCEPGEGRAWWYYMKYTTQCCEEECIDAFGFKYKNPDHSICMDYINNEKKQILWSNNFNYKFLEGNNYQFSLIANAKECQPQDREGNVIDSEAIIIGYINITTFSEGEGDGRKLYTTISYTLTNSDYEISDINLYLSNIERPVNLDPLFDEYNYDVNSAEWDSATTTFNKLPWPGLFNRWDTFIIPHVKVCKK